MTDSAPGAPDRTAGRLSRDDWLVSNSGERRDERRRQTLASVGQAGVNAHPLLAVMCASPEDPEQVIAALRVCPTLTSRVLGVVNSAAFRGSRAIETVERAVIQLGASRARAIGMAFGLRLLHESSRVTPEVSRQLWVSSVRKAAAAELACHGLDPAASSRAYCQALVQDLGLPLLFVVDPDFYQRGLVPGTRGDWSEQEVAWFGLDHGELGSRLLESWGAPEALVEAARGHHRPPTIVANAESDIGIRLAVFLASLMPHLDEELSGTQRDWLTALHGQFLAGTYPSPDAFVYAACQKAEHLVGSSAPIELGTLFIPLAMAVAEDAFELVTQLGRLEAALAQQHEVVDKFREEAFTDPLTRLLNRRGFTHLAERRRVEAVHRGLGVCCIMIDIDGLKPINDRYGHGAGDRLLRALAMVLRRNLDRADLVARLGGDEFAAFILDVDDARARQIAGRLVAVQSMRLRVAADADTTLRFSIGAVHVQQIEHSTQIEHLMAIADEAMYHRKQQGQGGLRYVRYGEAMKCDRKHSAG